MHPIKYGAHPHLQLQQQFMADDNDSSSSSVFFIPNPQQQQQSVFPYPLHSQQQHQHHENLSQQHSSPVTHQLFQHHQAQFQPFRHPESVHHHTHQQHLFSAVNFKLGLNENSGEKEVVLPLNHQHNEASFFHGNQQHEHSLLVPHCLHPHEDSPMKEPFWKPLNKYEDRQFGELEAIYGHGKGEGKAAQAGSGSALTWENSPANVSISMPLTEFHGHNIGGNGGVGNGSESTSIVKEASLRNKIQKKSRKMKMEELSSMVVFFGSLVKQVTDHQECLHKRFLEVVERMDKERSVKEESWRREEIERRNREAIARAQEQALASSREALIVSYLEKITGESISLPQRTPLFVQPESTIVKADNNGRWPIAEVEALIQVRCNLESKFREPGLKGALWEEVSSLMSSFGYQRSAKRCKEKWENINKYFRKSKETGKKLSQQSKTCSYFYQLDQLYSRIPINSDIEIQKQGDSDFLEPYIPQRDLKVSEMNSPKLDFDGTVGDKQGSNVKDNESRENYSENDGNVQEDDDNDSDGGE
ncbi:trihelix transcription factor GT-2-like isoform X1 [Hibiscus syriacus]|uniref:trihelix transcription factor GT-2-like isoform X1 n=1 Tax=Hibiscus syriacus TaxID=106335 RepID=UPI001921DCD5|nr:trihelix transcription factor GT-2-like isoform X1 [Hibiscus syriacus]